MAAATLTPNTAQNARIICTDNSASVAGWPHSPDLNAEENTTITESEHPAASDAAMTSRWREFRLKV